LRGAVSLIISPNSVRGQVSGFSRTGSRKLLIPDT
jgi:hypothetical protein